MSSGGPTAQGDGLTGNEVEVASRASGSSSDDGHVVAGELSHEEVISRLQAARNAGGFSEFDMAA